MATDSPRLPNISTLVNTSLNVFTQKLRQLIIWTIITIGVYLLATIISLILALILGAQLLPLFHGQLNMQAISSASISVTIAVIALIIIFSATGAISEAGFILIIATQFKKGYKELLRTSLGFIIPLFIVGIITPLILLGSTMVFLLPGIIFAFLFSFAGYEIVLNKATPLQAIQNSTRIMLDNFWGILGRVVLLWLVSLLAYYGVIALAQHQAPFGFFTIAYYVFRILFGWFSAVYSIILYKEARASTILKKPAPMIVIWIITIIGWLAIAGLVFLIIRFVSSGGLQQIQKSFQQSIPSTRVLSNTQKQLLNSQTLLNQIREASTNMQEPQRTEKIKSLNDQNINGLKKALLSDPNNPQLWQVLCVSYQLPNTIGTTSQEQLACSKSTLPTISPTQ